MKTYLYVCFQLATIIMNNLFLIIKETYLNDIFLGKKPKEYRITSDYFKKKLIDRHYDTITLQAGYQRNAPRLFLKYKGFVIEKITHEFFGPEEVEVFAIDVTEIIQAFNMKSEILLKSAGKIITGVTPDGTDDFHKHYLEQFKDGEQLFVPAFPNEFGRCGCNGKWRRRHN